jgi:hypothetical protein
MDWTVSLGLSRLKSIVSQSRRLESTLYIRLRASTLLSHHESNCDRFNFVSSHKKSRSFFDGRRLPLYETQRRSVESWSWVIISIVNSSPSYK